LPFNIGFLTVVIVHDPIFRVDVVRPSWREYLGVAELGGSVAAGGKDMVFG
jgi:hypothetical protein